VLIGDFFRFCTGSKCFYSRFSLAIGVMLVYRESAMSANATSNDGADLTCDEAAALLCVPPAALERWARQLSFPQDLGGEGGVRFRRPEIEALRDALVATHSVEGAVRAARDGSVTPVGG
jgi:hypothetical protein